MGTIKLTQLVFLINFRKLEIDPVLPSFFGNTLTTCSAGDIQEMKNVSCYSTCPAKPIQHNTVAYLLYCYMHR